MFRLVSIPVFLLLAVFSAWSGATETGPAGPHRPSGNTVQYDPMIQDIADAISGNTIDSYVSHLESFITRWALHDSSEAAARWIMTAFESFDMDTVYLHQFSDRFSGNVVAVKYGQNEPDSIVVIGGHYDSVSNNAFFAPGADDNASGTACVLECARVMAPHQFNRTVVFIAFGAEEQGRDGSEAFAAEAAARGDRILAMVNADMIGYVAENDQLDLDIITNDPSMWLRDRAFDVASVYVPDLSVVDGTLTTGFSDHVSFWDQGYDAIMLYEDSDQWSPFMHTTRDSVGNSYNSPELAEKTTRVAAALLADLAGPIPPPAPGGPPAAVVLDQNFPNPFRPNTTIRIEVAAPGNPVSLVIYDAAGRAVKSLLRNQHVSGETTVTWDGTNASGDPASSGVYFYRLTTGGETLARKMLLVR
jgi:hypothetical protein